MLSIMLRMTLVDYLGHQTSSLGFQSSSCAHVTHVAHVAAIVTSEKIISLHYTLLPTQ